MVKNPHIIARLLASKQSPGGSAPFVEIAGVVLLGIYTWYTIKMYCANKEAADAAKSAADSASDSLMDVQRAFVYVSAVRPNFDSPTTIDFLTEFENYGDTPANSVQEYTNVIWKPASDFNYRDQPPSSKLFPPPRLAYIPPHEQLFGVPLSVPKNIFDRNGIPQTAVKFYGHIECQDAFGCGHRYEYCMSLLWVNSAKGTAVLTLCPDHVCADKDCQDYKPTDKLICTAP